MVFLRQFTYWDVWKLFAPYSKISQDKEKWYRYSKTSLQVRCRVL